MLILMLDSFTRNGFFNENIGSYLKLYSRWFRFNIKFLFAILPFSLSPRRCRATLKEGTWKDFYRQDFRERWLTPFSIVGLM